MTIAIEDLRALVRDTDEVVFDDDALTVAINAAGDSILRAAGIAFSTLAAEYAALGRSTRTDDLAIDTKGRGHDLLAVAQSFFAQADAEDVRGSDDFLSVVEFGGRTASWPREDSVWWPDYPLGGWI